MEEKPVTQRREMRPFDWLNAASLVVMGVLLGFAAYGLFGLIGTSFWPVAVLIVILFGGIFLLQAVLDRLFQWFVPTGIKPAHESIPQQRRPLVVMLSLPVGFVIGVIAEQFELISPFFA